MEDKFRVLRSAERFVVNRQFDRAVIEYRGIIESHGEDPSVLNTLGDLLLKTNQREEALNCFSRVAEIFAQSGFVSKAIAIYRKVEQLSPGAREAVGKLAELYLRRGLRTEALRYWRRLAVLLEQASERDGLISTRRQIAELDDKNPEAHWDLAEVLASVSSDEASEEYLSAARLYLRSASFEEARSAAWKSLELDRSRFEAREIIAEAEEHLPASEETPEEPDSRRSEEADDLQAEADEWGRSLAEDLVEETVSEDLLLEESASPDESMGAKDISESDEESERSRIWNGESGWEDIEATQDVENLEDSFFDVVAPNRDARESHSVGEDVAAGPSEEPALEFELEPVASRSEERAASSARLENTAGIREDPSTPIQPPTAPAGEEGPHQDLLDEVDFYLKLDLREDAERVLRELLEQYPASREVRVRAEGIGLGIPEVPETVLKPHQHYVSDVESALDDLFLEDPPLGNDEPLIGFDGGRRVDSQDARSHFELGVAYRDLGMLDDAAMKFASAHRIFSSRNESAQMLRCAKMLVTTYMELGDHAAAINWADVALSMPGSDADDRRALEFDRALALEMSGRNEECLEAFNRILSEDPDYRDVRERVSRLGQLPG